MALLSAEWLYFKPDSPYLGSALSILADFTPIAIAMVGIVMSYKTPRKENHLITTLILIFCGLLGTGIMSWSRIRGEAAHKAEIGELNKKLDKVGEQNTTLGNYLLNSKNTGKLSEADRRKGIENVLRNEFILSHDPIDPQILAGNKMPPDEWMNKRLSEMGEKWTVKEEAKIAPASALTIQLPQYGNLKERTLQLSHDIEFYANSIQNMKRGGRTQSEQRTGQDFLINRYYTTFRPEVISIRDEFAKFNIRNLDLDQELQFESESPQEINLGAVYNICELLKDLASHIP